MVLLFVFLISALALLGVFLLLVKKVYAVSIVSLFYVGVVLYSVVGLFFYDYAKEVPWDFYYKVNYDSLVRAALIYSAFALSLVFGAIFIGKSSAPVSYGSLSSEGGISSLKKIAGRHWLVMVLVALVSPLFLVLSFGLDTLWARSGYDVDGWAAGSIVARVFLPVSTIALVFIPIMFVRWFLFLILYFSFFALTSRAVVLVPFFYFVAFYFFFGKVSLLRICVCAVLAVVGVVAALGFRLNSEQGLLPNLVYLFSEGLTVDIILEGLNYVLSYSLSYLAYMVQFVSYDPEIFWISINPMPSAWVNIQYVMEYARVAPRIPYAALGEIYLMLGWCSLILFMALGFLFSRLERFLVSRNLFFGILFIVLVVSFGLMATQYNLRGAARLVYYSFFVFALYFGWRFFVFLLRGNARLNG